tara:strand:- start:361 stop:603 length:243 start_codon:yes stop_codon:yes gene_type:complete
MINKKPTLKKSIQGPPAQSANKLKNKAEAETIAATLSPKARPIAKINKVDVGPVRRQSPQISASGMTDDPDIFKEPNGTI